MSSLGLLLWLLHVMTSFSMTSAFLSQKATYRAAVYSHRPVFPGHGLVDRSTAVRNVMKNVEIYKQQAILAAKQGAEIIVFPEDGLYGYAFSRTTIRPYLEPIPDPRTSAAWIPCTDRGRVTPSDILTQISCMARHNGMYVVVNMGDIQPCATTDPKCPHDGHYQYNTDVVFDPTGRLVARYHKRNLFGEHQFDVPEVEYTTFDTPFGRFGVFTCFDILFHDPAVQLVKQGVTNIAFPTAWINGGYPMLDSIIFHSAWAREQGVNLLAANLQYPERKFTGSGIYTHAGPVDYYINTTAGSGGRLVVGDVPIISPPTRTRIRNNGTSIDGLSPALVQFRQAVDKDAFTFVEVNDPSGTVSVCQGQTCCRLSYERESSGELFAFGVFGGLHLSFAKNWYFEACLLVRCTSRYHSSCGVLTRKSHTVFHSISISGQFTTDYVYPEVLVSRDGQAALTPPQEWQVETNGTLTASSLSSPLLVAALYARDYSRDP